MQSEPYLSDTIAGVIGASGTLIGAGATLTIPEIVAGMGFAESLSALGTFSLGTAAASSIPLAAGAVAGIYAYKMAYSQVESNQPEPTSSQIFAPSNETSNSQSVNDNSSPNSDNSSEKNNSQSSLDPLQAAFAALMLLGSIAAMHYINKSRINQRRLTLEGITATINNLMPKMARDIIVAIDSSIPKGNEEVEHKSDEEVEHKSAEEKQEQLENHKKLIEKLSEALNKSAKENYRFHGYINTAKLAEDLASFLPSDEYLGKILEVLESDQKQETNVGENVNHNFTEIYCGKGDTFFNNPEREEMERLAIFVDASKKKFGKAPETQAQRIQDFYHSEQQSPAAKESESLMEAFRKAQSSKKDSTSKNSKSESPKSKVANPKVSKLVSNSQVSYKL